MAESQQRADLVLEGGGVKGIGLLGAVLVLAEAGYSFPRVAGTSAGAIVASLVAAYQKDNRDLHELVEVMNTVDYRRFADGPVLERLTGRLGEGVELLLHEGAHSGSYLVDWLGANLETAGVTTFADLALDDPGGSLPDGQHYSVVVHASDLSRRHIASPALGATAMVRLLPEHYASRPERRWPVLFLLHGCCDTYQSWTRSTDVEQLTARGDVLEVMPDGGRAGFYSDWLVGPRWETFHLVELPRILQRDYRASTAMAIAGVSMGGLGALDYAARHRGVFRAAASFSGIVDTRLTQRESQRYVGLVHCQGADPSGLWGDPRDDATVWAEHNPYDLASHLRGIPAVPGRRHRETGTA